MSYFSYISIFNTLPKRYYVGILTVAAGMLLSSPVCAQLPQVAEGATRAVAESAARAMVKQVPLTIAEREVLPVAGKVTHKILYPQDRQSFRASVIPVIVPQNGQIVRIGTHQVYVPPVARGDYLNYFTEDYGHSGKFPQYAERDALVSVRELENSVQHILNVENNGQLFYRLLQGEVFEDAIPYYRYLPSERIDYLFIGEVHENQRVREEIMNLIRTVRKREPMRKIYFATEYASSTNKPFSALKLVRDGNGEEKNEIIFYSEEPLAISHQFEDLNIEGVSYRRENHRLLKQIMALDIPVVGLEPSLTLKHTPGKDERISDIDEDEILFLFRVSSSGMEKRNQEWVKTLQRLRAQDPDALIIVHGGLAHIGYDQDFPVSQQLEGNKFVINISPVGGLLTSPVFSRIELGFTQKEHFYKKKSNKYVFTLKPAGEEVLPQDREKILHALGADMTVVLHRF